MKTLTLKGEVGPDGKLHLDVPHDIPPGPVEVTLRPLKPPGEPQEDWWQFLQAARARMEAAGCDFMNDEEVQASIEELRSDDRTDEIYRQLDAERQQGEGA